MHKTPLSWLSLLLALPATAAPVPGPERPLTPPMSVESPAAKNAGAVPLADLLATAQSSGAVWAEGGEAIVYGSTQGGSMQLWKQSLTETQAVQLTSFPGPKGNLRVTPDGKQLAYQADVGGRAIHDLFLVGPESGDEPQNLTATPDVNELYPNFSPDGKWLAFSARQASASNDNILLMDVASGAIRQLTHESESGVHWAPAGFSDDGRWLVVNRYDYGMDFGEVFRIDTTNGELTQLSPSGTYHFASDVTPDGSSVAVAMETPTGLRQAAVLDVRTRKANVVQPSQWEQKTTDISPDGRFLLFTTNENGREAVYLHDLGQRATRRLSFPNGVNSAPGYVASLPTFSPDSRRILFPHTSGTSPVEYWVYDINEDRAQRVTSLSARPSQALPTTSIINYRSFDGTVISAVLWMPFNLQRDGQAPAVVIAHGGPTGQVMDVFHPAAIALASRGFVVVAPNFRGSTGYGQAFLRANQYDLGGGDLKDLEAGVDFLVDTGYVDRTRVGIHGGSYGGYMVLMALAKTDTFAAGVNMFGIVNWRTMWDRGAPQNRRYQAGLVGEPDTHAEVYDRASPLTYLEGLKAPLLVLHGENDPIVPAHEGRQVVEFLEQRGRQVQARFFEEEGHGFLQPDNQRETLERSVGWFEQHLAPRRTEPVMEGSP